MTKTTKTVELVFQDHVIGQYEAPESVTIFEVTVPEVPRTNTNMYNYFCLRFSFYKVRKTQNKYIHVFRFEGVSTRPSEKFNPSKREVNDNVQSL